MIGEISVIFQHLRSLLGAFQITFCEHLWDILMHELGRLYFTSWVYLLYQIGAVAVTLVFPC